ncbi:hypothetical protein MalM25_21460 [Planctomycetes bacterium MalM25]|nr:hypothetical protein MalM25_21460 [Planctomycetes bacterium MalM25]
MNTRPVALAGLMGAAVGGPYLATQAPDDWSNPWGGQTPPAAVAPGQPSSAFDPLSPPDLSGPQGPGAEIYRGAAAIEGPIGMPLEQALDWNVTKNWVYSQWARKSTGLADPTLFGVRVPLVTGSGMTDLAGSLTYYFDHAGVLQRMRLSGRTADTSLVVSLATRRFAMAPRTGHIAGDQLFQAVQENKLRGELRTRPRGVLWNTSPHDSFSVDLEVTRPGSPYVVTPYQAKFEAPGGAAAEVASKPGGAGEADPIFPARSVVPDANPADQAAASSAAKASSDAVGGPPSPALPSVGSPQAAPPPALAPLDGYRDRFRWPG